MDELTQSPYDDIIVKAALHFRLDANLIRSICFVESSFNPKATRFEPAWPYFNNVSMYANKLEISILDEQKDQMTSWGLMQVMGGVARDLGFTDHLEMLLEPEIGVFYGCLKLQKLSQSVMCHGDEEAIVSAYNAGTPKKTPGGLYRNQVYVDKVYTQLRKLRALS